MKTFLQKLFPALIFSFIVTLSFAQAGISDSSFGVNGITTYRYENNLSTSSSVIIQTDNKILVGGTTKIDNIYRFLLTRLNPNGLLDSSFGISGQVTTSFQSGESATSTCLTLQPDGKIIQAGYSGATSQQQIAIARFNSNGSLDTSFSSNGKLTSKIGAFARAIILMEDGKIMIGGTDGTNFLLARFNSDGQIDKTFANLGASKVTLISGSSSQVFSMAKQTDGKFVLAGGVVKTDADFDFGIARFKQDGSLDSTFSNDGIDTAIFIATISLFNYYLEIAKSVIIQDDNRIVLTGAAYSIFASNPSLPSAITMIRYNSDGTRDSSFGINSKVISKINYESSGASAVLQKDAKVLVSGQQSIFANSLFTSLVARYNENGVLDSSFGKNGSVSGDFVYNSEYTSGITLQSDNKIIVVGNNDSTIIVARYRNDPLQISIKKNISITEGNSGATPAKFNIVLDKAAATNVTVNYTTKDLSAKSGSDFTAKSGTVTFPAGAINRAVTINVTGDNIVEPNERFALVLSNPVNAVLGTVDSVICIIKNDDPSFAKNSITSEELETVKTIKLYPNPAKDVLSIEGLPIKQKTSVSIIDMNGKTLSTSITTTSIYHQNIKQLSPGAYFVKIESGNKSEIIKFIKQ